MAFRLILVGPVLLGCLGPARAADKPRVPKIPTPSLSTLLGADSPDALAGNLRGHLIRSLPEVLYEANDGWGDTRSVARGLEWHPREGRKLPLRPHVQRKPKNDGDWRKIRVLAPNLADTLIVDIRDLQSGPGQLTFNAFLAFDARATLDHQKWTAGIKYYSTDVRVRFRAKLRLTCVATFRLEPGDSILPDAVLRLAVTKAELGYDHFVTEHVAGVGGEAAQLLGDAARAALRRWHPSLERELLAKADAAILKAGTAKEVRVNLANLLKKAAGK